MTVSPFSKEDLEVFWRSSGGLEVPAAAGHLRRKEQRRLKDGALPELAGWLAGLAGHVPELAGDGGSCCRGGRVVRSAQPTWSWWTPGTASRAQLRAPARLRCLSACGFGPRHLGLCFGLGGPLDAFARSRFGVLVADLLGDRQGLLVMVDRFPVAAQVPVDVGEFAEGPGLAALVADVAADGES